MKGEANQGVIAFYEGFEFKATPKVSNYTVTVMSGGNAEDFPQSSNMFDVKLRNRISKLKRGDKFYINEIKAVGPDLIPVKLSGLMIKVK